MDIVFGITIGILILYFIYPLALRVCASPRPAGREKEVDSVSEVTLILLTLNGKNYLEEKISFLLKELEAFMRFQLIIIDDASSDGSRELLEKYRHLEHISLVLKNRQHGIPHSMNLGVGKARYPVIVFCDQRQRLANNILEQLVGPLKYKDVGAVSGCISHHDKSCSISVIRQYENLLKILESDLGCLMGVYGPLYAIKKSCYTPIPEAIILDDLYLSLRILKNNSVVIRKRCCIYDENFSRLYNYARARRYLAGFLQLLREKTLISDLTPLQCAMLMWHKYLRLTIPVLLFLSYITLAFNLSKGAGFVVAFGAITLAVIFSLIPLKWNLLMKFRNIIRMNIYYFVAAMELLAEHLLTKARRFFNKAQPAKSYSPND